MENSVNLAFDKSITRLAGNSYGRQIYKSQVEGVIDFTQTAYIVFPEQIVAVASSFVQGFFEEIIKEVGILGIGTKVKVLAPSMDVETKILKNLL